MNSLLSEQDESNLILAIREQELRTSAEIRVCISEKWIFRHQHYAWKIFRKTGMFNTREHNAVLIMLMPRVHRIVIIGDSAINHLVPDQFWQECVESMITIMRQHGALSSLHEGLRLVGDVLSQHWPRRPDDMNELPDELIRD
jgi:uncharacterized membrane protein